MKKNNIILSDCFPFRGSGDRVNFDKFIKGIYGGNVSAAKLDSLYNGVIGNSMPRPNSIEINQMSANILGAYRSNKIYINRQIVSDSLLGQESCFILLLALLHEYGHFLDEHLNGPPSGGGGNTNDEKGKAFAERFIRYSAADLFNNPSFEFADFKATDDRGNEYVRTAKISSLGYEQRMGIFSFFEYSEYIANGDLELPDGETISNAEFFSLDAHKDLTREGARLASLAILNNPSVDELWLEAYSVWQDDNAGGLIQLYKSHYGENQYWHSMYSGQAYAGQPLSTNLKNEGVKEKIIGQAKEWYEEAIKKKATNMLKSLLNLGRLCHMVQDSYCLSHCWRRYTKDTYIGQVLSGMNAITSAENDNIWNFQDYRKQDTNFHKYADESKQRKGTPQEKLTIGYESAKKATKEIMEMYSANKPWSTLKSHLNDKVYKIHLGRENKAGSGCHPLFLKSLDDRTGEVKNYLWELSREHS
jgi:hypothetical protein